MTFQNQLLDQVGIPIIEGAVVGVVTYAFAAPLTQYAPSVAFLTGGVWMAHAFNMRVPKKYRKVEINKMGNHSPAAAYDLTLAPTQPVNIYLTKTDGSEANRYHLTLGQIRVTERVAFHLIVLGGYMSRPYMVDMWHVLKRDAKNGPNLREYQALYVEREWMRWKNPNSENAGLEMLETGRTVFEYFAKRYASPTEEERLEIRRAQKRRTHPTNQPPTNPRSPYPITEKRGCYAS